MRRLELLRAEMRCARRRWDGVDKNKMLELRRLVATYRLSVLLGDVLYIDGHWYVTHSGLLRLAARRNCIGIRTVLERRCCDATTNRWVFKAVVHKSVSSRGFVGYGDADPSNVSARVRGAEMRVAETRAVNRALRKAYGIGLCSVEELGWEPRTTAPSEPKIPPAVNSGHQSGNSRLRDRLCLLIRQHQLDANLVKAYAADFCGTPNLRDASREQIEQFINDLSDWAVRDRAALLCKLNSYARPQEVHS
jgi:hypothetical protein